MKRITGYGKYFVDTQGRVYSSMTGSLVEKARTPMNNGYLKVTLSRGGSEKQFLVHRLVALAYLPNPEGKRTVNHKNGDRHDNSLCNLEWATYAENHQHSFKKLGRESGTKGKRGLDCSNSKPVIQLVRNHGVFHGSTAEAARHTCAHSIAISRVCRGTQKTAGGFRWRWATEDEIQTHGGFTYAK